MTVLCLEEEHNPSATKEAGELEALGPDMPATVLHEPKDTHMLWELWTALGQLIKFASVKLPLGAAGESAWVLY